MILLRFDAYFATLLTLLHRQECLCYLKAQHFFDFLFQLALFKRTALNFVQADGVDQILGAQQPEQLAHIQFGHQDLFVALENLRKICG